MKATASEQKTRRPIEAWEVPYLEAFGHALRALRRQAGLRQADLAWLASLCAASVGNLERARRRTRRSTIERIAAALASEGAGDADAITAHLVALAGPALAPESEYSERIARRRERRERRKAKIERRAQELAVSMAVDMAQAHVDAWRQSGRVPR